MGRALLPAATFVPPTCRPVMASRARGLACGILAHRTASVPRTTFVCSASFPEYIPAKFAADIEETAAVSMMQHMQRVELEVPGLGKVQTAYFSAPYSGKGDGNKGKSQRPTFVLLHGFDSSMLEFRRFAPILAEAGDVYAVDLAGWGFSDCGFGSNPDISLGPQQKRSHLHSFCKSVIGRQVVLVGTSLGKALYLFSHTCICIYI